MTTVQCKTFLQLLDNYLDKTLEPERQAEIERHLEQCARCRHELEAHQRIIASLKQLEKKSAPATLHAEVLSRLQERAERVPWRTRIQSLLSPRKLRIAMEIAAVFIVVFIGWQIFNSSSLQVTLRDRKATTPGGVRYLGTALETERAAPLSFGPATLGDTVVKLETGLPGAMEKGAAFGITTTEPPEKAELKKEVYESLARPVAPQVEGVVIVPSTAPAKEVAGGQMVIKEEIVGGRMEFVPAPSRDDNAMMGDVVRVPQVQAPAPKQLPLSEPERVLMGEEDLRAVQPYVVSRPSTVQERMFSEEVDKLEERRLDIKAKPEAEVADYLALPSHGAIKATPYLPTEGPISRGEIVRKNGILVNGEMPRPPGSPAPGVSIADGDREKAGFIAERPEQDRIKGRRERIYVVPATVVISAAPGQALRFQGAFVSVSDLSKQSKVVERILRQNRGNVLSLKESKDEITIKSMLPASAYRKFVDQLENKGFMIKREVPPQITDKAREEETDDSKAGLRYYSQIKIRDDYVESRKLIPKGEPTSEPSRRSLVEKRRRVQVAPTPVVIFESSIHITIIIQGASPSSVPTP